MIKYSKFAYTRFEKLTPNDVAMGYIEMANKVLAGQIHIDGDEEKQVKEREKAARILANLRGTR